ncbi:MAG TPA: RHS repeat-associated core domain-containing protein [Solimonas sp.]|nr:RHS repeat-associated core domain-containing protein [Solimonas sp.]
MAEATEQVGATAGSFEVSPAGAAEYSIPMALPPGTGGMTPTVALTYSSQGGNGIVGLGWSLSAAPQITRCGTTIQRDGYFDGVDFDTNDQFCLNGQRLVAITGSYGRDGTEYRTEVEEFSKVISYGGPSSGPYDPASFRVWSKAGLIFDYGSTPDSRWDVSGFAFGWGLARTTDSTGNYMEYFYDEGGSTNQVTLSRIAYTGNVGAGLVPYADVVFSYESRPDTSRQYLYGLPIDNLKRLRAISTRFNGAYVRTLWLSYESSYGFGTERSRLTSVEECVTDGCLRPTIIEWQKQNNAFAWQWDNRFSPPYNIVADVSGNNAGVKDMGARFVDANGDGRTDLLFNRDSTDGPIADTYLGTSSGWQKTGYPGQKPPVNIVADSVAGSDGPQDMGVRFAYLNGDDLIDFVHYRDYGSGIQAGAYFSTGTGWTNASSTYTPPYPVVTDGVSSGVGTSDMGVRFEDLNGDGRVDVLYNRFVGFGTYKGAYLNTGSGWGPNVPAYEPPYHIVADGSATGGVGTEDMGVRFVDVNGDGLVDMLYNRWVNSGLTYAGAYLNSPSGWVAAPEYTPPHYFVADDVAGASGTQDMGVRFADLNGDGLVDFMYSRYVNATTQESGAWLNTGRGWVFDANYTPPIYFVADAAGGAVGIQDVGARVVDVNGDGLADLVQGRVPASGSIFSAWLNTGHGWRQANEYAPPYEIVRDGAGGGSGPQDMGARFEDVNGDGVVDFIFHRYYNPAAYKGAYLNPTPAEQVIRITDGLGAQISIEYASLTDPTVYAKGSGSTYPIMDVQTPMKVVKSYTMTNGVGGTNVRRHFYRGLKVHQRGLGTLGFSQCEETDEARGIRTVTQYRQDFPYVGAVSNSTTETTAGEILSAETTTYPLPAPTFGSGTSLRYFVAPTQVLRRSHEIQPFAQLVKTSITDYVYGDAYGNLTSSTQKDYAGSESGIPFTTVTASTYFAPDTSRWFLGRLQEVQVTRNGPLQVPQTRKSRFEYSPYTGLLSVEVIEPGQAQFELTTSYGRDALGNITEKTISGPNIPTRTHQEGFNAAYPDFGRFNTSTTNAVGHGWTRTFDPATGQLISKTDPNGLITQYQSDRLGRATGQTFNQLGINTSSTIQRLWCSQTTLCNDARGVSAIRTSDSTGADGISVLDVMGREVRRAVLNPQGDYIQAFTFYDAAGRVQKRSSPTTLYGTTYWTQYSYDAVGRVTQENAPISTAQPSGRITKREYRGLVTAETDALLHVTTRESNALGKLVKVTDAANGVVEYTYDQFDNLSSTKDAGGATTLIESDIRGRKRQMTDPDMGLWKYEYDVLGQLTKQTDAKNQIVTMGYDLIGRLTSRAEPEGVSSWVYDTLRKGALTSVTSPGYKREYQYHPFGAVSEELVSIEDATAPPGRVSIDAYTASPQSFAEGYSTTLSWSASEVYGKCLASGSLPGWGGNKLATGSQVVRVVTAGSYSATLRCNDALGGSSTRSLNITVGPSPVVSIGWFSASPATINARETTTLSWSATNAFTCRGEGTLPGWPGNKNAASGYQDLKIDTAGEYDASLVCTDIADRVATKSVHVTVKPCLTPALVCINPVSFPSNPLLNDLVWLVQSMILTGVPPAPTSGEQSSPETSAPSGGFQQFRFTYAYDSQGRLVTTTYPSGLPVVNRYNAYGAVDRVYSGATQATYWEAVAWDQWGPMSQARAGDYLNRSRAFDAASGRLNAISTNSSTAMVQYLGVGWDLAGNLRARVDHLQGDMQETFFYDALNRLDYSTLKNAPGAPGEVQNLNVDYSANGNISSKSDVGNYAYSTRPNAATTAGSGTYTYDANGNMSVGAGRTYTWSSYNLPTRVAQSGADSQWLYGPERQRIRQVQTTGSYGSLIYYPSASFEEHRRGSTVEQKHYIASPAGFVVVDTRSANYSRIDYLLEDHLGSVTLITDQTGQVVQNLSYDAFGKRRGATWRGAMTGEAQTRKGYTGHEEMDNLGLVHMNGRVYDPSLARFVSADPTIQAPDLSQSHNRFSYVMNNPLTLTDPSGFWWGNNVMGSEFKRWERGTREEIRRPNSNLPSYVHVVGAYLSTKCGYWAAACAGGGNFVFSRWQGHSERQSLRNGAVAAASVYAYQYIGDYFKYGGGSTLPAAVREGGRVVAHGVVGGATSELSGGSFREGFYASALSAATPSTGVMPIDLLLHALVGGTVAELGGGKFANGAQTAAFGYLFNEYKHRGSRTPTNAERPHLYDDYVIEAVETYNDQGGFSPGDKEYLTPDLVKAMIGTESAFDLRAYVSDPMQVNVPRDWDAEKTKYGLKRGVVPGPALSILAGIGWLGYKSYIYDAEGIAVQFRGWSTAVGRYNGGGDPNYVEKVYTQCPSCPR